MINLTAENTNLNFLSPLKFAFTIKKLPQVNFYVQSLVLPSITVQPNMQPTPFVKLPIPGDHVDYGEVQITFKVDEDMANYLEIFNWLTAIGFPENFGQYKALADKDARQNVGGTDGIMTDGTIIIYNSASNVNMQVKLINMFPTGLMDLLFDLKQVDVDYIEATATFAFERMQISRI
jgi:hypothetical protein